MDEATTAAEVLPADAGTPARGVRRLSGMLDSAVRSILGQCRSVTAVSDSLSGGEASTGGPACLASPAGGDAGGYGLASPGPGGDAARKRRVPLSSANVNVAAPVGSASKHASELITSSERKKPRQSRGSGLSSPQYAAGAGDEADADVTPRNLSAAFQAHSPSPASEAAARGSKAAKGKAHGGEKKPKKSLGLFSPVFTLLGSRFKGSAEGSDDAEHADPADDAGLASDTPHAVAMGGMKEDPDASENEACGEAFGFVSEEDLLAMDEEADDLEDYEYEGDDDVDFDPFYFIKHLPPLEQCVPAHRRTLLPKQTRAMMRGAGGAGGRRKTLVLDLDETLVHSCVEGEGAGDDFDFTFPVHLNGDVYTIFVWIRPGALTFLEQMSRHYEIVIFTASQKVYAETLLNILDHERRFIRHRLFRDSCVLVAGNYLKDLSILGRDLKETIIVDNSPQAFAFQLANGVPIESWFDDDKDRELIKLVPFLRKLSSATCEDVRPHIQKRFKLHQRVQRA